LKEKVYISGKAVNCSLGEDLDEVIASIRDKVVRVDDLPLTLVRLPYTRPYYRMRRDRGTDTEKLFYDVLLETTAKAFDDAGLDECEIRDMSIFFGSTSIDIPIYESYYEKSDTNGSVYFSQASLGYGSIIADAARHFDIRGGCYTFTTACTSSANGLLYAAEMIRLGAIERALVIGYDLYNHTGFYGFESLKLMSPTHYRPFDKNRDGIIMGEGCGAVILEGKKRRDADFHILGGANLCDTFNVTTHTVEGDFIAETIEQALANAGLKPADIDAVKAHATGSDNNDRTECNGMKKVFGDGMPPVTGIKPYVGHTVGASGVIELIIVTESVKRGFFPATAGFAQPDEELGVTPLMDNLEIDRGNFMLNYFGFGGNCTSLIVSNRD
jgi:3-oxoacyl-(acyl-carrier-protein) synthase